MVIFGWAVIGIVAAMPTALVATVRAWPAVCTAREGEVAMTTTTRDGLAEIARVRRVHFDVEPEVVMRGADRVKVGFQVHLWGIHARGARPLPGCSKCWELVEDLRRIAEEVVPPDDRPTRTELAPFRPALYESRVAPDSDEVSVTIQLVHRDGYDHPVDACEERCLKEIRSRLIALGIPER